MNALSDGFWSNVIAVGFIGFLIALFGSIRNGFDSNGKARPKLQLWLAAGFFCLGALFVALSQHSAPLPNAETQERAALFAR